MGNPCIICNKFYKIKCSYEHGKRNGKCYVSITLLQIIIDNRIFALFYFMFSWQTKDFRSEGRLSIGSTGRKNMFVKLGLVGSSLDAKGGIVGGTIELANIDTYSK